MREREIERERERERGRKRVESSDWEVCAFYYEIGLHELVAKVMRVCGCVTVKAVVPGSLLSCTPEDSPKEES